jgi:hypothetical protein
MPSAKGSALCYLTLHELAPTNPKVSENFGIEHMASFLHK